MSKEIEAQRKGAEIYHGSATCKQIFLELLDEFSIPRRVFLVAEVEAAEFEELGFNRATGFFWIRQKAKTEWKTSKTATFYYGEEVTGFIKERHLSKLGGVKGKDGMFSLPILEFIVDCPTAGKVKVRHHRRCQPRQPPRRLPKRCRIRP
ncbi:hypothetical protein SASPL_124112 [Salvia splendens]|uniref:Uncharacterized protein n=1 Tax=Salvia splendens TaxID=180675 RepID=A0A8X8XPW3_SALSN|nr:uncharacterized protein LOC121746073 [Salvia splendens]KAG6416677.1 hypothetical protein SASPL_124112 [Salvia splendens]